MDGSSNIGSVSGPYAFSNLSSNSGAVPRSISCANGSPDSTTDDVPGRCLVHALDPGSCHHHTK